MKKNVLIIAYAYPPNNIAGAQRPYALAKYLDKAKYSVQVITCENPDLSIGENKDFNPTLEGVQLIKIKSLIGNSASKLRSEKNLKRKNSNSLSKLKSFLFKTGQNLIFPDKAMFWFPNVKTFLKQNQELINKTDVVFSTSPGVTNHKIARLIKRKNKKIHWIADFRDFNYVENWNTKTGIKSFLHKKLEHSIIKESNSLTYVTKTMQSAYQNFYPQYQQKMYEVYNGFDKADFAKITQVVKEHKILKFFYAGSFYNGLRSPLPLLQLLDQAFKDNLITKEEVQIEIAGNIDEETKTQMKEFQSNYCANFQGNLPREDVLKQMSNATFLWLIVGNIKSHYQTIPIKLFEYIATRRPIVNFAPEESEVSQIISEKGLGFNFDTKDFNLKESYPNFKDLIMNFKKGIYNESLSEASLESFKWENQIKLLENLV